MAIALMSVFGSTYFCEQIFSHMKFILSSQRCRLPEDHLEACVQLKVTRYSLSFAIKLRQWTVTVKYKNVWHARLLNVKIIHKLAHCVQKVADPCCIRQYFPFHVS